MKAMSEELIKSRLRIGDAALAARAIRPACEPLPDLAETDEFGRNFDRFSSARVVLLGEATHGTSEFYRARAAITRRLVERHGFSIVAIEGDWPDALRIDRYVRDRDVSVEEGQNFERFPSWMWRNEDVLDFVTWLRAHNARLPMRRRVEFRGLDIYSMRNSIAAVLGYLEQVDPAAARIARQRYGCLTPWQDEPAWYGRVVLQGRHDPCEGQIVAQLRDLLERRLDYAARDGETFFDAAQNARVVLAAEQYYRIMYRGSTESWNLRDRHMFDTLQRLLAHRGDDARAVVWAHNSHVGNAMATRMGWQGEFNIGELCRTAHGGNAILIGFGTDRGTVAAADDWNEPMKIKPVRPSRPDSYERVFRETGMPRWLLDLRGEASSDIRRILSEPRLERAIGVIYRPETELQSHYFEAILPEQFDAYVWLEETRAVTPLAAGRPEGVPDTFPFGV